MRNGKLLILLLLPVFAAVLGTALWGRYLANEGPLAAPTKVTVRAGAGTSEIANALMEKGVIGAKWAFVGAVRVMALDGTLKAGEYEFEPKISLRAVVNKLATGDAAQRKVTMAEGLTVKQVMALLDKTEGLTGKLTAVPEGTLWPDTYAFRLGTDRAKLMETMTARMEKELTLAWELKAADVPLDTPQDLLVLASVVQKEAAHDAEMPTVAAVFLNRLRKGMKLQSDPTVIYGAEFDGNIRRKDLKEEHPFNTYIYEGLPPTPISNPGRAALRAVALPDAVPYLFFVAKPDRSGHVFATTYEEHKKNVKAYWEAQKRHEKRGGVSGTVVTTKDVQ